MNLLAETSNAFGGMFGILIALTLLVVSIAAMWKTYEKANQPGWAAIVPIYNLYILLKIAGRPGWWLLLFLLPIVNFVIYIIISLDIAKAFGKSSTFGIIGLWLFSFVGYVMLGFGDATYEGAKTE